jgi:hypothetical protein
MMSVQNNHKRNDLRVEVVRNLNDFMKVVAIRSSVFLAEQDCPYDEEFDNNDLSSLHLIAYLRDEPVATLRVRWFANFAKIERDRRRYHQPQRLCVRHRLHPETSRPVLETTRFPSSRGPGGFPFLRFRLCRVLAATRTEGGRFEHRR